MIQETDIYGESTLKSMSGADKFNRWMYVQMKRLYAGENIGNRILYWKYFKPFDKRS